MRQGWVWGLYVLSLAWVGLVFVYVERSMEASHAEAFRQEGRRLVSIWADRIAERGEPPLRERLLRRFAGDVDSRSVALLNDQGQTLRCVGESSPPPPRLPFSEPIDRPLKNNTWAYWSPLWVAGRREGYLAWTRDSSFLGKERTKAQRGLLAAWAWWAVVGALGAVFAGRRKLPSARLEDARS